MLPAKSEDFGGYMSDVNKRIQKTWTPPNDIMDSHAEVLFRVNKYGEVLYSQITKSSGNSEFDKSVKEALNHCVFDEFPADSKREFITIQYSFNLHSADTERMKEYAELAEKYYSCDKNLALKYLDMAIEEIKGDSCSYFLYARRCKLNNELGNKEAANSDLAEFERLKALNDEKRIRACKKDVQEIGSPFAYFSLANAYDAAGDYENAIVAINQAIKMTPLNNAYIRYRADIIIRHDNELN